MLSDSSRLQDFPSLEKMTYLNTAAEGLPAPGVREALDLYGEHKMLGMSGRDFHFEELESCRKVVARFFKKRPCEVSFCSCSSEAYNLLATSLDLQSGDEVIITDLDFPAGATPWMVAKAPEVRLWKNRKGELLLEDLEERLMAQTRLVQVSLVSFLNGYRIPWNDFRDLVRRRAPQALICVDVTQALGRVELDCLDADCIISSTHKWVLALHGGCIVAIRDEVADRLTTQAGGWFHLDNAFESDRFDQARIHKGAASYSVGMPNFSAIYALRAGLQYIENIGVSAITKRADPLVQFLFHELENRNVELMAPLQPESDCSGIISFQHPQAEEIHYALLDESVHIMHHAGRLRIAVHGYNRVEDVQKLLSVLDASMRSLS